MGLCVSPTRSLLLFDAWHTQADKVSYRDFLGEARFR